MTEKTYHRSDPEPPASVTVLEDLNGGFYKYLVRQGDGWVWNSHPSEDLDDTPHQWSDVVRNSGGLRVYQATTPKLAFVGPEPEPAEEPAVTLPFKIDPNFKRSIVDSRGFEITEVSGGNTTTEEDQDLAELIRDLLNKHFGA